MDSNTDVGHWYDAANIVIIINLSNIFIAKMYDGATGANNDYNLNAIWIKTFQAASHETRSPEIDCLNPSIGLMVGMITWSP